MYAFSLAHSDKTLVVYFEGHLHFSMAVYVFSVNFFLPAATIITFLILFQHELIFIQMAGFS